jgi:hypothetical protein
VKGYLVSFNWGELVAEVMRYSTQSGMCTGHPPSAFQQSHTAQPLLATPQHLPRALTG